MRPKSSGAKATPGERVVQHIKRAAYFGRRSAILAERARIKRDTIHHRCLPNRKLAA